MSTSPERLNKLIISDDARDAFSRLISHAAHSLHVTAYAISKASALDSHLHTSVYRQLIDAPARGIHCQMLIATHPTNSPHEANNTLSAIELARAGWHVRRATRSPIMHAKLLIADENAAMIGSHNLTRAGIETNRELSIVTTDYMIVQPALQWFSIMYETAAKHQDVQP